VAPLKDSDRLNAYKDALSNWQFAGYIEFELNETAYRWLRRELDGVTTRELGRLMHEHVLQGGEIDEVPEKRLEWAYEYEFHYDLRFSIQGNPIYIETRLRFRPPYVPDSAWILLVNVHEP
jgi:hypothetical protein